MSAWNFRRVLGCALFALVFSVNSSFAQRMSGHYAVILEDPPVIDRFPGRDAARSMAAQNYRMNIEARQQSLTSELTARGFHVVGAISTLGNHLYVATTPDRVDELKNLPGVLGVIPMRRVRQRVNRATVLANAPVAWNALGGQGKAGAGMKIAILDSGIDQNNPAFQDSSLSMPSGYPKCTTGHSEDCAYTNNKVIVARSYVRQLSAGSDPKNVAADSGPDDYSPRDRDGHGTAVASAAAASPAVTPAIASGFMGMAPHAYLGNYKVSGSPGMPGGGASNASDGNGGVGWEDVAVLALNDAFDDQMDIANYSSGVIAMFAPLDTGSVCGQPAGVPCDYIAYMFEKAAQRGMLITVAAGNDGYSGQTYPTGNNISSPSNAPSVISVGSTNNSHVFQPSVSVQAGPSNLVGISAQTTDVYVYYGQYYYGALPAPVVDVAAISSSNQYACSALPAYSLYNAYALIQQSPASGGCTFFTSATNAANAGATGVIYYASSGAATPIQVEDNFGDVPIFGPTVMISASDGAALKAYVDAHAGTTVLVDPAGTEQDVAAFNALVTSVFPPGFQPPVAANQLNSFSSTGPDAGDFAIKPDIIATGGGEAGYSISDFIYPHGMYLATQSYDQNSFLYSPNGFIAADGTSFAAPLTAGAAALLWHLHPTYTPQQIKALLVNAASQTTTEDVYGNPVDVLSVGSGRLDAGAASANTVIAQVVTTDKTNPVAVSFGSITALPVSKQIQITNLGSSSVNLALSVSAPVDFAGTAAAGASAALDKTTLTVAASSSQVVTLTISGTMPPPDEYGGLVTIQNSGGSTPVAIRVPYLLVIPTNVVWDMLPMMYSQIVSPYGEAQPCFESLPGQPLPAPGYVAIKLIDTAGAPMPNQPVKFTISPRNGVTMSSYAHGEPACSPSGSGTGVTCNTDNYGIAYTAVTVGTAVGSIPMITATALGISFEFGGQDVNYCQPAVITAPNITSISEAAVGSTGIAPGSYISIYGTNLVDSWYVVNGPPAYGDSAYFLPLPMNMDAVTVSFDVPGAYDGTPAHYSGRPGYFTFVGNAGTQLNIQVPWELQGASSAQVKVTVDGFADSNVVTIPLVQFAPQLFQSCSGICAIDLTTYGSNPTPISASNPAHAGDTVELYGNGFGPVNWTNPVSGGPAPTSPLPRTTSTVTVSVGGQDAPVGYAGLAPTYPALYQINITIPSVSAGNQAVVATVGGASSKSVTIPIK
jgi:uncharacterized protein (TIGR03437 family)